MARTLSVRLRFLLALMVVAVLGVGVTGAVAVVAVSSRLDRIGGALTPASEANADVLQAMTDAETGVRGYLLAGDPALLEPYRGARARAEARLGMIERLVADDPVVGRLVAEQRRQVDAWFDGYAVPAVTGGSAAPGRVHDGKAMLDDIRDTNARLGRHLRGERAHLREQTAWLRDAGVWWVVGLTVAAAAVATVAGGRTVRWTLVPAARLRAVVDDLRRGDHAVRADADHGPAEVRAVAQAVNALADENDRLRAQAVQTARLRRAATETARDVRAELHRGAAAHAAAQGLGTLLGADRAWFRPVEDGPAPARLTGVAADWAAAGAVPVAGQGEDVEGHVDLEVVRRLRRDEEVLVHEESMATSLSAPVGGADDVLGVLTLLFPPGRHLSAAERSAVQSVSADLGRALEQARLFEQQLELVDRLQELDRQKTEFLSTVSHELRTPLTSIAGYAELIRDGDAGPVTPELDRMLEVVERNTVRLRTLIEDLLTLARIESGTFTGSDAATPLEPLVRAATATIAPLAERGSVRIEADPVPPQAVVRGDGMQLERVLLNLLSNAVKFTPPGGRVQVGVRVDDAEVVLTCADTGIGIPAAEQQHLFDRFFRASNATEQAIPGTGLGLVVVRGIAERHGGSVELDSTHREGTTVTVRLPRLGAGTPDHPAAFPRSVRPLAH